MRTATKRVSPLMWVGGKHDQVARIVAAFQGAETYGTYVEVFGLCVRALRDGAARIRPHASEQVFSRQLECKCSDSMVAKLYNDVR